MGCVYKAFDRDLGRTVAIKTLHGIDRLQPNALARFRREAQAASRVVHPNLVIIYSYGTQGDTPYIVMEYLSGRSLAAEIAEGPLSVERTANVLVAACAGVHAAHRANVVHRDLKPGNIFLARTPMGETPKILDFAFRAWGATTPTSPARVTSSAPRTISRPNRLPAARSTRAPTSTP